MATRKAVLIAHYSFDVDWVRKINPDIETYIYTSCGTSKFEPIKHKKRLVLNKGMDANMYLQYILDKWDDMPDFTLFCHHHETNWTQDLPMWEIANRLKWDFAPYFSVGSRNYYGVVWDNCGGEHHQIIKDNWYIFERYIPFTDKATYHCGTQFVASAEIIKRKPKDYYEYLLNWLHTTELDDYYSARMFEYYWHYLLTGDHNEVYRPLTDILND